MIGGKLSVTEICSYLKDQNFNLTQDKIFKDLHANWDIMWDIMVFLCDRIKDTRYEQLEPSLSHVMETDHYQCAVKKMRDYIGVSSVFNKLNYPFEYYPLKDIVRPEKDHSLTEKISRLIQANQFHKDLRKRFEFMHLEEESLSNSIREEKKRETQIMQDIYEQKIIKESEREGVEEKTQAIENYKKEYAYKKKQKLDLMNSKEELEQKLDIKKKQLNNCIYQKEDDLIKIKQLEREVIKNAPKLKKERYELLKEVEDLGKAVESEIKNADEIQTFLKSRFSQLEEMVQRSKTKEIEELSQKRRSLVESLRQEEEKSVHLREKKNHLLEIKKQTLHTIRNQEKRKRETTEKLDKKSDSHRHNIDMLTKMQNEVRRQEETVAALEENNKISIEQEKRLVTKGRLSHDTWREQINQAERRIVEMRDEALDIIESTFIDIK